MTSKRLTALVMGAAMLALPVEPAQAGDNFVGGLVGGLIGGAIANGIAHQPRRTHTRTVVRHRVAVPSAVRQERREIQTSLNYFGFDAGGADGVMGRRSRAAVSRYQVYMGFPATGQISEYEKVLLLGAYRRAVAGGPDVSRIIAKSHDGTRAVLVAQRDGATGGAHSTGYAGLPLAVSEAVDEVADSSDPSAEQLLQRSGFIQLADLNGDGNNDYILDTALAGSSFWCNAAQCKTIVFASTADGYRRNDMLLHQPTPASFDCRGGVCQVKAGGDVAPQAPRQQPQQQVPNQPRLASGESAAPDAVTLPVFTTQAPAKSLDAFCNKVDLLANANGGFTQVSDVSDSDSGPDLALNAQFCQERSYAVSAGEELMATVQGADARQIEAQCDTFGASMAKYVTSLTQKPAESVLHDVGGLILKSGMTPDQLRTTARICLASGYQTDKMQTALGSVLLLTAMGERPYGELAGHHLDSGFGVASRHDMALDWYGLALGALDGGAEPVFGPAQTGRTELLRAALTGSPGGSMRQPVPASADNAAVPVFALSK